MEKNAVLSTPAAKSSRAKNASIDFISGAISGILVKTASAPADRMKLLYQTRTNEYGHYSIPQMFSRIFHEQGIFSFWRGNFPSIMRYFPQQAFMLTFREQFRPFAKVIPQTSHFLRLFSNVVSGGAAGSFALFLVYPLDVARTRMAADIGLSGPNGTREFNGMIDCLRKMYRAYGFTSWYGGLVSGLIAYFFYRGIQIGGYDTMKVHFGLDLREPDIQTFNDSMATFVQHFALSFAFTCTASAVVYPLDTVRRKCMMVNHEHKKIKLFECGRNIWRQYGFIGFYRGLTINFIRGFGSSSLLVAFDYIKPNVESVVVKYWK